MKEVCTRRILFLNTYFSFEFNLKGKLSFENSLPFLYVYVLKV